MKSVMDRDDEINGRGGCDNAGGCNCRCNDDGRGCYNGYHCGRHSRGCHSDCG